MSNSKKPLKKHLTFAMFIDWADTHYQHNLLDGVADFVKEHNINLLCIEGGSLESKRQYESQRNIMYDLVNKDNIDGLIILSAAIGHFAGQHVMTEFCRKYYPLPIVSLSMDIENTSSIFVDNFTGFQNLLAHLIEVHGLQRLMFVSGPGDNQDSMERFAVYKDTLKKYGIPFDKDLVVEGDFTAGTGKKAVSLLLDERKVKFDAIVAANDDMALGVLDELNARGIQVPEEIAVVGFDDLEMGSYSSPPLTTVSQSFYEQGYKAAEVLLNMIEKKAPPEKIILPSKLVLRESCGCFSLATITAASDGADIILKNTSNLEKNKQQIISSIIDTCRQLFINKTSPEFPLIIEQLFDSFLQEITGQNKNCFLKTCFQLLQKSVHTRKNVYLGQLVLSTLRQNILPYITDQRVLLHAENLWHQVSVMIGEKAIQQEKYIRHISVRNNELLNLMREELLVALNMSQVTDVLAQRLPQLGIKSCYLVMFHEKTDETYQTSKLILAYNEKGRIELDENKTVFPSSKLLPDFLPAHGKQHNLLVVSLCFAHIQFGYIMFEINSEDSTIYGTLRRLISSAFQGVLLFKQVQDQEKDLIAQQEHLKNMAQLRKAMEGFIQTISLTVETRDKYTAGHQIRVADLARAIAAEMNIPEDKVEGIRMAAIVHDLGKIYVPIDILNKPGKLMEIEFRLIKVHPEIAYDILKSIDFPWPIAEVILQHHERINGSGYPRGLKGDEIRLEAKILAVADVIEAMASHRPYRPALGIEKALAEISKNKAILYDANVVEACLRLFLKKNFRLTEQPAIHN